MLVYFGNNSKVIAAKERVQNLFGRERQRLVDAILTQKKFDYSTASPAELVNMISQYWDIYKTEIVLYKTRWPWSKTLAYTNDAKTIHLNSRRLDRSVESISGTIMHELVHCADNAFPNIRCGHGSNDSHNKDGSFPYWLGYWAKNYLQK